MHLLSSLIAGIRGAENGVVQVFERATATRATWYEDFEGHGADSSGADIPLGSSGEAVVFVEELVDVVVKNSLGVTVRSWTDGYSAACVELRSDSFTGIDYDTAASKAGNPTNVNAALSLWNDSAGAIDWEVGSGGTPLEDAVVAVEGIFYSVKVYGAVGDGVANDAAAITSAIAAATAAGGGTVFFPPGIYLVNSSITQNVLSPFKGSGSGSSFLRMNNASAGLTWAALIEDLTIDSSLNLSGAVITQGVSTGLRLVRNAIGSASFSATTCIEGGAQASMTIDSCLFNVQGATQSALLLSAAAYSLRMQNSEILVHAGTYSGVLVNVPANGVDLQCVNCLFDWQASFGAASTGFLVDYDTAGSLSLAGCEFTASSSPVVTLIDFDSSTNVDSHFSEVGTTIVGWTGTPTNLTLYDLTGMTVTTQRFLLMARQARRIAYVTDAAALTIDSLNYGSIVVERSTNAASTVTFTDAPVGCEVTVLYHNNHAAGGGTITFDTTRVDMVAASNQFTLAANTYRYFRFRSEYFNSTLRWVEVELAAADEPE